MSDKYAVHPTKQLRFDGRLVDIDIEMVPAITEMWRAGLETLDCCQDVGEAMEQLRPHYPHYAWCIDHDHGRAGIGFYDPFTLARFFEILSNSGPRDAFYVRMRHHIAPGAWEVRLGFFDEADEIADGAPPIASRFEPGWPHLTFPKSDLDEIVQRLRAHNDGVDKAPDEIDWSSVEVEVDDEPGAANDPGKP